MKKSIRCSLGILTVLVVLLLSLDIKKLDEYHAAGTSVVFSSEKYAFDIWENKLPEVTDNAPDFIVLAGLLKSDSEKAFREFGRKLGISKTWYFMTKGMGVIKTVEEENLMVKLDENLNTRIAISFIFGNAIRDGSGAVDIDEFLNMTDFNNVSIELNSLVKNNIIPVLKENAEPGLILEFAGAFEINEDSIDAQTIRIIPVSVKFSNGITQ